MSPQFDREPVQDIAALLSRYGADEFASPFRSTVPLLALLKDGAPHLNSLLAELGMPNDASLHFEYRVDPARGKGRPSQTDLMVLSGDRSLAIEAKWTEPRYETVRERAGRDEDNPNRLQVIDGWIELVNRQAGPATNFAGVSDCMYQMLHRAASACAAAPHPSLAYLVFRMEGDPVKTFYSEDLETLHRVLGNPSGFPFWFIDAELKPTAAFEALRGLRKGAPDTSNKVRAALLTEHLFECGSMDARMVVQG